MSDFDMQGNRLDKGMQTGISLLLGVGAGVSLAGGGLRALAGALGGMPSAAVRAAAYGVCIALCLLFLSALVKKARAKAPGALDRLAAACEEMPPAQALGGAAGLLAGLLAAALLTQALRVMTPSLLLLGLSAGVFALLGYAGWYLGRRLCTGLIQAKAAPDAQEHPPKILDTSVIIDGRIFDICKAGFLEGELTIPGFVLAELRHIADSGDALRRNRGRRGLDVLSRIQNELGRRVRIDETDYDDIAEVDVKLLRLSRERNGIVVTNDFNLNKVAGVTGVCVLNINELANAVKPVVLPGEEMTVQVVREGKEPGQGVGYLDDGTMVVVDNARRHVGETLDVVVTTVLQTSAGRMIFTRMKPLESRAG